MSEGDYGSGGNAALALGYNIFGNEDLDGYRPNDTMLDHHKHVSSLQHLNPNFSTQTNPIFCELPVFLTHPGAKPS